MGWFLLKIMTDYLLNHELAGIDDHIFLNSYIVSSCIKAAR